MEDAHIVLYARKITAAPATAAAGGGHPPGPLLEAGGPQHQQQQLDDLGSHGRRLSVAGGQHLLSQLLLGIGGPSQRVNEGYIFLPAEGNGLNNGREANAPHAAPAQARTAAAQAAGGEGEDAVDAADADTGEAEAEGLTPTNKKSMKVTKSVLRQFSRRRRSQAAAAHPEGEAGEAGAPPGSPRGAPGGGGGRAGGSLACRETSTGGAVAGEGGPQGAGCQQADLCIFAVFDGHGGAHVSR